ncbi:MAG: hypothetical protein NTV74_07595 [Euryarchaeota archaeon]|nr:hypothetical protein [Euryarchaeota archaeon]
MEGEEKMMSKKIWMTLVSIISVTLMVATSVEAAIGTSSYVGDAKREVKIESTPVVYADSGRIGLNQAAKIDTESEVKSTESVVLIAGTTEIDTKSEIKPAEPVPPVDGTAEIDAKPEIKPDESVVPTDDATDANSGIDAPIETDDFTDENGSSEPDNGLIWLVVEGDEVSDGDSETPDVDPNGSGLELANDMGTTIPGSPGSFPIEVDEVFVASSNGLVDKVVSIDTTLPLNILGYARIDVLSGNENLNDGPYFEGLDIFDQLSLAAASTLMMFLVRAIQLLDIAFPLADSILIATTICAWMLEKVLYMIENGFSWVTIDITICGFTLSNPIRTALGKLINPILEKIVDFLVPIAKDSALDIVDYFQNLKTLFEKTDFRELIEQLYDSSSLAVYAILQVLQNKDTAQIKTWLEQFVNPSVAQILVSLLNSYDGLFVSIRDNIFGKFDTFMTYGREATALRNIHVEINQNCQVEEGQYAAIIRINATSAGQVFDSKIIGILYDGSGSDVPSLDESADVIATNNVMEGMNSQAQGYNQGATNI